MKTNGEDILTSLTTDGEDTLMTHITASDYLVTTPHDVTEDPCDSIDNFYGIHCPHDWDQVTKRMTMWQQGWLMTQTYDVANPVWWPMWWLLWTCDDQSDDQNTTPMTLMTMGDYIGWSMWRPVNGPGNFHDDMWGLHLAILQPKLKAVCLAGLLWKFW